jgi:hypothetical protein
MSRQGLARHNARRDQNETIIVEALEARGFHVDRISGAGIPDLIVSKSGLMKQGCGATRHMWLVEIKKPKGTYTPKQIQWRSRFQGPSPITLRTVDEALTFPESAKADKARKAQIA